MFFKSISRSKHQDTPRYGWIQEAVRISVGEFKGSVTSMKNVKYVLTVFVKKLGINREKRK